MTDSRCDHHAEKALPTFFETEKTMCCTREECGDHFRDESDRLREVIVMKDKETAMLQLIQILDSGADGYGDLDSLIEKIVELMDVIDGDISPNLYPECGWEREDITLVGPDDDDDDEDEDADDITRRDAKCSRKGMVTPMSPKEGHGESMKLSAFNPYDICDYRTKKPATELRQLAELKFKEIEDFLQREAFEGKETEYALVMADLREKIKVLREAFQLRFQRLRTTVLEARSFHPIFLLLLQYITATVPRFRDHPIASGSKLDLVSRFESAVTVTAPITASGHTDFIMCKRGAGQAVTADSVQALIELKPPHGGLMTKDAVPCKRQAIGQVVSLDHLRFPTRKSYLSRSTNDRYLVSTCVVTDLFAVSLYFLHRLGTGWDGQLRTVMTARVVNLKHYVELLLYGLCSHTRTEFCDLSEEELIPPAIMENEEFGDDSNLPPPSNNDQPTQDIDALESMINNQDQFTLCDRLPNFSSFYSSPLTETVRVYHLSNAHNSTVPSAADEGQPLKCVARLLLFEDDDGESRPETI